MIGERIGAFEVISKLGEGGMGTVYRARDTRLNRDVAIKVLPPLVAGDPDRLARFDREAKTLAALNHPHIAQIYGIEALSTSSGQGTVLVMELVEGDDLTSRVGRGPMPLADVLPIARQIAEALESAHDLGIVHRDLKPANVKVRTDGAVKVIDFGLAKAFDPDGTGVSNAATESTTMGAAGTEPGMILGTAAYMSPEQARGRAVDKRTDIWAFGVVLYEMLAGTRAFAGKGFSDTVAAVLRREIEWTKLPRDLPPRLRHLLERCLDPDVKTRLRDIGEARVTLAALERGDRDVADPAAAVSASADGRASRRERVAWMMAAIATLVAIALAVISRTHWAGAAPSGEATAGVTRLSVMPPAGLSINPESANLAISPNGRLVAFTVGVGVSSENQLWVRSLDTAIAKRIEAGDGASLPFWSPDSTRIGFFASRKIKTVPAAGGPADIVCDAPFGRGATWNATNTIVFAPDAAGPLYRVAAAGGTPIAATVLDESRHQTGHRFPVFLPDGDHFLYAALPRVDQLPDIIAGSLSDPHLKTRVGMMESAPVYAAPGWLLFTRQGVLAAQAFDAAALRTTGDVVSLGDEPGVAPGTAAYDAGRRVSASSTGSLAFIPDPAVNTTVEWRDPSGKLTGTVSVRPGRYTTVAMSPDGARAVLERSDGATAWSLWVVDLVRGGAVPLADDVVRAASPIWSPDSRQVAFEAVRGGELTLLDRMVGDASPARRIMRLDNSHPSSWFKDEILLSQIDPGTKWNVYRTAASGAGKPIAVVQGPAIEVGGVVSPDGHRIAYLSDESGNLDVFVQAYPDGGTKQQISTGGAQHTWWERDGRHLLFARRDQTMWRVATDFSGAPERIGEFPPAVVALDLDRVGNRFLTLVPEHAGVAAVTVVQSWLSAIPTRR